MWGQRRLRALPPSRPADLPGSVRDPEPEADRSATSSSSRSIVNGIGTRRRARAAGARALESAGLRPGRGLRPALSARAVRRPAPACRHRRRAGHGSGVHRRGRARVDARRVDPDRAPPAHARPAGGARADLPVHHARPVAGVGHRRPDRGDVPRQDHGDRAGRAGHPQPAEPLHAGARLGLPDPGAPDAGRTGTPHDPGRRNAGRRAHPDRLPVQPSLSERVRPLPGRGAAAHRRGRGPDERVLAGRGRTAPAGARRGPGRRAGRDRCAGSDEAAAPGD